MPNSSIKSFIRDYSHLAPLVAEALQSMFSPVYQVEQLFKNRAIRDSFAQLIVAIELIQVCQGKKPSNEFIKLFRECALDEERDESRFLIHFATLLYLDKRKKLFKAIIRHPDFPHLLAPQVIRIAKHAIKNEGIANRSRLDSDAVKIKGAVKKARIKSNERKVSSKDESQFIEEAFEPKENFYKKIFASEQEANLKKSIKAYIKKSYRSDRARNIVAYINYLLAGKEGKLHRSQAATSLGISRKSFYQVQKALQKDRPFKRLLKTYLKNSR